MDGFKRPLRRPQPELEASRMLPRPVVPGALPEHGTPDAPVQWDHQAPDIDLNLQGAGTPVGTPKRGKTGKIIAIIIATIVLAVAGMGVWGIEQLKPVDASDTIEQKVQVVEGTAFTYVSSRLKERGLIRNTFVFDIYARLSGQRSAIQAGTCKLSPADSSQEILKKLTAGCQDFISIMFFPGATLVDSKYKPAKQDVTSVLLKAGFSEAEISAALSKRYTGPLFADKPADTDLEGYVFGETYYVDTNFTVEQILQKSFDEMYAQITANNLIPKFEKQGLTLYQAITLASIVQREVHSQEDMNQVAQVFIDRYKSDMSLGSDVTFIYGADKLGVAPTVDLDSPYNTRNRVGLPPGPISSPSIMALKAIANPAPGDYVYFVAGDDGKTYFARTEAQHQANIKKYCQKLCSEL